MTGIDHTHDPAACSWVPDADAYADFPVQNLPLGVFSGGGGTPRIGVDIGDWCVDLEALAPRLPEEARAALAEPALNAVFARPQLLIARPDGIFNVLRQKVHIEGIELNLAVQMPIEGLKLSTGYAHLSGRYDSNGDDVIDTDLDGANISPDRLNLAASYVRGPISARVQTQFYFSGSFNGLARDPRNDFGGYNLTDASIRYRTGIGAVTFSVSNLFDRQYITYASDTQRPTDNTFFFAGQGRAFTLGWDNRF